MQDFRKALDMLPPDQREALVLVGAAGMSYEETAEIAHCAVGTVKSTNARALAKLRVSPDLAGGYRPGVPTAFPHGDRP